MNWEKKKNAETCASQGPGWKTDCVTTFDLLFSELLNESRARDTFTSTESK